MGRPQHSTRRRRVPSALPESTVLTYPVALEAILAAKVRLLSQLLASRTLERTSIIVAVCALAFALLLNRHLFRRCLIHGCSLLRF